MGIFNRVNRTPANPVALIRDPDGAPAVNLAKVRAGGHIELAKNADEAGIALAARNLSGIRAQAVCLLDTSKSMYPDFRDQRVQKLVERMLGFTLQIDSDGVVPIIAFDYHAHPQVDVTLDNYRNVVNDRIWRPDHMGSTNLADALRIVRDMASRTLMPLYVAVLTDGEPDEEKPVTKLVCDLSRYPVFLKFMALKPVEYLAELDKLDDSHRMLDNCNAQPRRGTGLNLLSCTDAQFQSAMAEEWDVWVSRALAAGVLTS